MNVGRVVHVVRSDSFSGVERYVADTATELHRRGWSVSVVGGDPLNMTGSLPAGVDYFAAATVPAVARRLWSLGRVDVVHAHMTAAELPAALLKRRSGGRLVVTRHFAGRRGSSPLGRLAGSVISRRVDAQIAISRFVADAVGEPCLVIHNGIAPSTCPGLPRERIVIALQRLEQEKDTATALRAWAASGLGNDGWRLTIYGRGSQLVELRSLSAELDVDASVELGGFVTTPRAQLSRAGIMLATAPAEPFGLAVLEAMAEGTPVVASAGGAHSETLGVDGVYFPPGDATRCAAELKRLADSPAVREELGRQLRETYDERFTIERHVDALVECYHPSPSSALT